MCVQIRSGIENILLVNIYRPPNASISCFLTEFASLLEQVCLNKHRLFITGDFNIHVDNENDNTAKRFSNILDIFSLSQHVKSPTHTSGHTLDLVITRKDDPPYTQPMPGLLISDHFCVTCSLDLKATSPETKTISFRKIKGINIDDFRLYKRL